MSNPSSLRELQNIWYQQLADQGFEDIENTEVYGSPLKQFHSYSFVNPNLQIRIELRTEYQRKAEEFFHCAGFDEICTLIVRHGHSRLKAPQIAQIWELHLQGLTERQIAAQMNRSKTCIHLILERVRSWMNLVV